MLRRLLTLSLSLIACLPNAYAASFYVAPTIMYQGVSAKNADYMGITGRLTAGYGGEIYDSGIYLAGELFANPNGVSLHNHEGGTPGLKPKYSFGAAVLPGYYLDDNLLAYLRLGFIDTRFEHLDLYRPGYFAGIGAEFNLSGCWFVRGDYTYISYQSIDHLGNPKSDEYALGLLYRFA